MFEKEAYVFADSKNSFWRQGRTCIDSVKQAYQQGAEFGYKKGFEECAKARLNVTTISDCPIKDEWHYVKDEGYPKDDKQYLVLFFCNYKGKKEMSCGVRDNLHSDFETHKCYTEQIIAWKEIVLPELKENE